MMMNALGQRIAPHQPTCQALCQRLDDTDLQCKAPVRDLSGEGSRLIQQRLCAPGQPRDDLPERR
jgi:hypothetical protein